MERIVSAFGILLIIIGCQGLELTLSRQASASLGGRTGCGVLVCDEVSQGSGNPTPTTPTRDDTDQNDDDSMGSQRSILEMSVIKHSQASSDSRSGQGQGRLMASLTSVQPSVTRVSDGVKVDGHLTAGRATLHLELFKQDDCRAEYTCQVLQRDSQGRDHVSSSRLLQQRSDEFSLQADEGRWSPVVALQLLSLVHEMDNKVAQIGSSTQDSWQLSFHTLENRLEDKLATIQNRMEDKIASIEDRLEYKLDTFENRIEDKTKSLGKNLEDALAHFEDELDGKISNQRNLIMSDLNTKIKNDESSLETFNKKVIEENVIKLREDFKAAEDQILATVESVSNKLQSTLNVTTASLSSVENNLSLLQNANSNDNICMKDLEGALLNVSITSNHSAHLVEAQLISMNQTMNLKLTQLASDVKDTAMVSHNTLRDMFSAEQTNITGNIQAILIDSLSVRSCRKGVFSVIAHSPFPYPLVRPNEQSNLDFPYLCDTLTDGGGWIVIQRRTTGDVDFYRNWEDYKNGFGSLDGDFWIGNDKIHAITASGTYELRVLLKYKGKSSYAHYSSFSLSDEKSNYVLHLGAYDGTAGDSLGHHKGKQFTTRDRDNDEHSGANCAIEHTGAWWYVACHASNLNGKWGAKNYDGPEWRTVSKGEPLSFTEMKIRRVEDP